MVQNKSSLQEKQSKVPKLDLTKAVSNAAASNQPKKVSNIKPETKKTDESVKNAKTEEKIPSQVEVPKQDKTPTSLKNTNEKGISVSPDIFVSLKKGLISDYYKIGKTLGEGNDSLLINFVLYLEI